MKFLLFAAFSMTGAIASPQIYWTETRPEGAFVVRANADGSGPVEIVAGAASIKGPNGLEYGNGQLFWPDQQLNRISTAKPDGTGVATFIDANNPYDVFIGSDRVYWTSQSGGYIDSAKPDGTDAGRLLGRDAVTSPFAIEVTAANIYWSEVSGSGRIRRSDLNGGNIVTVVNGVYTYDMQIAGDYIYIGDNNFPAAIKRAKLDGSDLKTLLPVGFVNGIWITKDAIYWSDLTSINRAGLDGSNPVTLHETDFSKPDRGIVVLDDAPASEQPVLGNPRQVGAQLVFSVQAKAGSTVHIEKSGLRPLAWGEVASFTAGAEAVNVTNVISPAVNEIFRARVP